MFTKPHHSPHNQLPILDQDAFYDTFKDIGIPLEADRVLDSAAEYALNHWLHELNAIDPSLAEESYKDAASVETFASIGLINEVPPKSDQYMHALVDGGIKKVYDHRLSYLEDMQNQGISFGEVVLFGGQRFRKPQDDEAGRLEQIAQEALPRLNSWGRDWVTAELAKENSHAPFKGSFATEHHVGVLALLDRYGDRLEHYGTQQRPEAVSLHPKLPAVTTQYELFEVGGQVFKVLDSPAIIRRYLGAELPLQNARPTGSSCYNDWEAQLPESYQASALLITSNPHTYRSWHDILLGKPPTTKQIRLDAAGAPIEQSLSHMDLLWEFGRLIISLKRAADRQVQRLA